MTAMMMISISLCVGAGVWLLLSHDSFRVVIGLAIIGSAVNLVVFLSGRPGSLVPPIIDTGADRLATDAANPLPQALVLTAIVIGFALLCFGFVLAARLGDPNDSDADIRRLTDSEPPTVPGSDEPLKPPEMD